MKVETGLTEVTGAAKRWAYNALDAAITLEVAEELQLHLSADPNKDRHYRFSMAQQAPAFAMMMRGLRVDEEAREGAVKAQETVEQDAVAKLSAMVPPDALPQAKQEAKCPHTANGAHSWKGGSTCSRCGVTKHMAGTFNPHSPTQVSNLFYNVLELPPERNHKTHKVSTDDECLERLARKYPDEAAALVDAVLEARGARKQLGLLRAPLDADGRWRTSFNVGAATSGRWSSSDSPWGTGGNIQNIADRSRNIFVPDPGLMLFYADYRQAESKVVAFDAEDEGYIEAHERGDPATYVARWVWPDAQPWTGDLKTDKELAKQPTPWNPNLSLRDYAKHISHGSAIGMTEHGIARDARIKVAEARKAQRTYFARFPRVKARQDELWQSIVETRTITNPLGRRRYVRGRIFGPEANSTRRECLAQIQQSTIADWVGIAITRVWMEMDGGCGSPHPGDPNRIWLLAQVHDAILGLVRPGDDAALQQLQDLMGFHLDIRGRRLAISTEVMVGKSWRKDDLVEWKPGMEWPR